MSFKQWLHNLFSGIPAHIQEYADKALHITTIIKQALDNPVADIITALIPGTWDDVLKGQILHYLEEIIPALTVVDECAGQPIDQMIQCWIVHVKELPKDMQDAVLAKLASLLICYQDGSELTQHMYDFYLQLAYSYKK